MLKCRELAYFEEDLGSGLLGNLVADLDALSNLQSSKDNFCEASSDKCTVFC